MATKKTTNSEKRSKTELRRLAEEKLSEQKVQEERHRLGKKDIEHLLHELQVHQIELEMQNEELLNAHDELAESQKRYVDLYDLAPVGYCIISLDGIILEANLTASAMLNVTRSRMIKRSITEFIFSEDQDIYFHYRRELFRTGEPQVCELRLVKKGSEPFWAHLDATVAHDTHADRSNKNGDDQVCHVVMSDISGLKKAEEKLLRKVNELEQWQKMTFGRELKMVDLKKEIDDLLAEAGKPFRYRINKEDN